jgi:hypothetical protein
VSVPRKRFHAFLSHAHADKAAVDRLYAWLRKADIPVWYDAFDLPPASDIATFLPKAILNSRACILILSKTSVGRGWVQKEYSLATNYQTKFPAFRILPIRIDDVEDPGGFVDNYSRIDAPNGELTPEAATALLLGLYYNDPDVELGRARDIYVARGWRPEEFSTADYVCRLLVAAGFRLIGDSEDQQSWDEARLHGIISSCGGVAAILPHRPNSAEGTSKYILRELRIAESLGLPSLVIADPEVPLPDELNSAALRLGGPGTGGEPHDTALEAAILTLWEDWREPATPRYSFLATDFDREHRRRNDMMRRVMQTVTGMECFLGQGVREGSVQKIIVDRIAGASLVIADISSDNLNTCIEAGIARGARRPLYLIAKGPERRPPFMFRDLEVSHYDDDTDLIGVVNRLVYPHRRRILNSDVAAGGLSS